MEDWRTKKANTPGQNMLLGMLGLDSGRLVMSSHSQQVRPINHCSIVFKNVLQEEGVMQLYWPHTATVNLQCTNQSKCT